MSRSLARLALSLGVAFSIVAATAPAPAMADPTAPAAGEEIVQVALTLTGSSAPALAFARSKGLHVDLVTRHTVLLSGPATQAADAFGARLHRVAARGNPSGAARYLAPAAVPTVPAALRGAVGAVIGLDNRPLFEHHAVPGGYTGSDLSTAYAATGLTGAGAGITVATVQFDGWYPSDATTYANAAGIALGANQITTVQLPSSNATPGGGGDQEVALDVEAVLATAPKAAQRVYVAPNNAAGAIAVYNQIADDVAAGQVQVVSTSWGACEASFPTNVLPQLATPIDRLVASGATMFAASGDSGAYDCATAQTPDGQLAVDFPASLPSVVAVGGTRLTRNSSGAYAETGWGPAPTTTAGTTFPGRGSGGGTSAVFARPAYQSSVSASGTGRAVPDVSALADASTGFGAYSVSAGGWRLFGGTSFGSPMWAGHLASALSTDGRSSGLGDIHAALYAAPSAFRDVTSGANGYYTASGGYDQVTGLGSPQWTALYAALGLHHRATTTVDRISGLNRVLTAVEASKAHFENAGQPHGASAVVLASSEGFADGVSGGPLAAAVNGPLLLTGGSSLDPSTAAEIMRILPKGGTIDVLGGIGAISANVASSLSNLGFTVTRLAGADRYATAVAVAESLPGVTTVLLTSGLVFPDALSAGPAAAHAGGVVLLTYGTTLPSATKDYLAAHVGAEVFAVGGDAAKAAPTIPASHQLVGADRYETGTKVAGYFFNHPTRLTFASGEDFPDALSGGAFASLLDSPILLVRSDLVPAVVTSYLKANETSVSGSALVGGAGVVSENVRTSLERTLNGF
ncbi:MAG: cell wall-binding repeat-containing protein [Dermatophilaceae bacterium]